MVHFCNSTLSFALQTYDLDILEKELSQAKRKVVKTDVHAEVVDTVKDEVKTSRAKQRKNMFKKTRSGQPVMKYRIEKILETIKK